MIADIPTYGGNEQPVSAIAWCCSDPRCWRVAVVVVSDFVVSLRRLEKQMGMGRVKVDRKKNNYYDYEPLGTESDLLCECPTNSDD